MISAITTQAEEESGTCGVCGGDAPPDSVICVPCGKAVALPKTVEALNESLLREKIQGKQNEELREALRLFADAYRGTPVPGTATVDPWPMIDKILQEE